MDCVGGEVLQVQDLLEVEGGGLLVQFVHQVLREVLHCAVLGKDDVALVGRVNGSTPCVGLREVGCKPDGSGCRWCRLVVLQQVEVPHQGVLGPGEEVGDRAWWLY